MLATKFPFKSIFVDLDGTLLNSQKTISQKNIDCLNYFIKNGVHVVVATGRTVKSASNIINGINLKAPIITLNGADIRSKIDGYSLRVTYLESQLQKEIFHFCKIVVNEFQIENILCDTGASFYVFNPHNLNLTEFMNHYDEQPQLLDLNNPPTEQAVGFLFLLSDDSKKEEFILMKKKLLPKEAKLCTFNGWPWIEIGSPKSNKGLAMEFVCEHLGITCNDVIAFGDGENDVEMLQMAGLGVAMENADKHALSASKARARSHDEDGVACFLENLIQLKAV